VIISGNVTFLLKVYFNTIVYLYFHTLFGIQKGSIADFNMSRQTIENQLDSGDSCAFLQCYNSVETWFGSIIEAATLIDPKNFPKLQDYLLPTEVSNQF